MTLLLVAAALLASPMAQAYVVTDWNITTTDIASRSEPLAADYAALRRRLLAE